MVTEKLRLDAFFIIILLKLSQFRNNGKFCEEHLLTKIHVFVSVKEPWKFHLKKKVTPDF